MNLDLTEELLDEVEYVNVGTPDNLIEINNSNNATLPIKIKENNQNKNEDYDSNGEIVN